MMFAKKYQTLSNSERKVTSLATSSECYKTLFGWYRFQGAAGTQMAVACPTSLDTCGENFPGWMKGAHPTVDEGIVTKKVCFKKNECCSEDINIQVNNCTSCYIYKLHGTPSGKL